MTETTERWAWLRRYVGDEVDLSDTVPMGRGALTEVPRWIAELAYPSYGRKHRQSSLERILERGGFGSAEVIGHLAAELLRAREETELLRRVVSGLIDAMVNAGIDTREGKAAERMRAARELVGGDGRG